MTATPGSRRAQSAAQTRELILRAALEHFTRDGYARATVNDIAKSAGVVVATVYTSVGGKPVLLEQLVREGVERDVVARTLERVALATTGRQVVDLIAAGTRESHRVDRDVVALLLNTAGLEPVARQLLAEVTTAYRSALAVAATRMSEIGALAEGVDVARATDVLWYFFGLHGRVRLLSGAEWSDDDASAWLAETAARALVTDR
jgi:AcrR family transcriptional regulator